MDNFSLIITVYLGLAYIFSIIKVNVVVSLYWGCGGGQGAGPETWPKHFWGSPAENVENPWPIGRIEEGLSEGLIAKCNDDSGVEQRLAEPAWWWLP